jgi:hypothetical protein
MQPKDLQQPANEYCYNIKFSSFRLLFNNTIPKSYRFSLFKGQHFLGFTIGKNLFANGLAANKP